MMGSKQRHFAPLIQASLEELVPRDHFYRHLEQSLDLSFVREFVHESYAQKGLYWLLGASVQKQALRDGERNPFSACTHRRVGVESDLVYSILMIEQCYFHVMEKLFLWLVFFP